MNEVVTTRRPVTASRSTSSSSCSALVASRRARAAPARNIKATIPSRTRWGTRWKRATPMVTAMTTWTRNAPAAPIHTANGLPRVAMTSEANMVLSGSSPKKMIGKTAKTTATFDGAPSRRSEGCSSVPATTVWRERRSHPPACRSGDRVSRTLGPAGPVCRPPIAGLLPFRADSSRTGTAPPHLVPRDIVTHALPLGSVQPQDRCLRHGQRGRPTGRHRRGRRPRAGGHRRRRRGGRGRRHGRHQPAPVRTGR